MAFTEKLEIRRPRTAAEAYDLWLDELPESERVSVTKALRSKSWSNPELKPILEEDEDYPAPVFGMTAFREWRAGLLA
ncbi:MULTISPECIES: hypothetical protein [unclassified Microbacterium]|uniref:hypothetical protein n=1 Tax=unclassified Microbacterium TaxID=2609290 RepID=UPI00301B2165